MKQRLLMLMSVLSVLTGASLAQARGGTSNGVMVSASAYMYNVTTDSSPGGKTDSKTSLYDLKLGYLSGNGLYLGGLYTIRSQENGSSESGKALGASVGYVGSEGFYLQGHYILSAEKGDYSEGTGLQADFGYLTNVTGAMYVGVELSYRSIEYKKNSTIPGFEKMKMDELFPLLTVGFLF